MTEQSIYNRCKKQVDKWNAEYEALCKEYGQRDLLVDDDNNFYGIEPLTLVKDDDDHLWRLDCDGFLSEPIYDYYEDTHELLDNSQGSSYWGDGFKACMTQYKKDLRRGRKFLAMPTERIDRIQNGDEEYNDED